MQATVIIILLNIFRLESYDRNHDFGHSVTPTCSYKMLLPDVKSFCDLTSGVGMTSLTQSAVDAFLGPLEGSLDGGRSLYSNG